MTPHDRLQLYLVGFNDGFKHALALHRQLSAAEAPVDKPSPPAVVAARRDAPLQPSATNPPQASRGRSPSGLANGAVEAAKPPRRRKSALTPSEEFALLAITENPGLSAMELRRRCGVKSVGPIYTLIRRRKVRRVEDPKPHTPNQPWVRFYPVEPTNG